MPDLVDHLVTASEAAIRDQQQSLTHKPEQVRGVTIELTVSRDGQVKDAITYVERRANADALLAGNGAWDANPRRPLRTEAPTRGAVTRGAHLEGRRRGLRLS